MDITVLYVKDCPNLEPLMEELSEIIDERDDDFEVKTILVTSDEQARELSFHGSPTILLNGKDPFPYAKGEIGLSCRRYEHRLSDPVSSSGFPGIDELKKVLS